MSLAYDLQLKRETDAEIKKTDIARQNSHTDAIVHANDSTNYLKLSVDESSSMAAVTRKDAVRAEELASSAHTMMMVLQGELARLERLLSRESSARKSLESTVAKLSSELSHVHGLALAEDETRLTSMDVSKLQGDMTAIHCALSNDIDLDDMNGGDIILSAAEIIAEAGALEKTVRFRMKANVLAQVGHSWAQFAPPTPVFTVGTLAETPLIVGTPTFVNGILDVTFSLPDGAWADAQQGTLTVKVATDDLLLGSGPAGQTVTSHAVTVSIIA